MQTYWQGELSKGDSLVDIDFPRRSTKEEAYQDASDRALDDQVPSASEWTERVPGESINTGRIYSGE